MTLKGLSGYSRALYSNWFWHQPLQLVVDAGEGLALALGSSVFGVSVIALTHGHSDHLLGLPGFAAARRFGKGAPEKPYVVLYPGGADGVEVIREGIARLWRDVEFPITWVPMNAGDRHPLSAKRWIEAFAVEHVSPEPAFGYRVLESRRRLRPEFASMPQHDLERMARQRGRNAVMEEYSHVLFAHSGDAMPIDVTLATNGDLLVHDATFLEPEDRREPIHASAREVFAVAREASVRTLILHHLSIRYQREQAMATLRAQLAASGFAGDCWLLDESSFLNLR